MNDGLPSCLSSKINMAIGFSANDLFTENSIYEITILYNTENYLLKKKIKLFT